MDARRADALPVRYAGLDDIVNRVPVSVVWEITLACDLACSFCGSRAGHRRRDELSAAEALDLVGQIAELGARDVGLIGGEAYLRKDWLEIIAAIRAAGMRCDLQTGGRNLSEERVSRAAAAGLCGVGISLTVSARPMTASAACRAPTSSRWRRYAAFTPMACLRPSTPPSTLVRCRNCAN